MADTCIVCLGDLATADECLHQSPASADIAAAVPHDHSARGKPQPSAALTTLDESAIIAHLLPCGHCLHNECLRPWVERANSCPICRQNFNEVELQGYVGGPVLSTYAVQDKKQTADVDPSMIVDDELFDHPVEPCLLCEEFGDPETLLLCDGCNASCHTFCAGLDGVPAGPWFCQFCMEDRILQDVDRSTRLTRNSRRRRRASADGPPQEWARVWQTVWDNLNLDLDFPFDDETGSGRRTVAQDREFAQWQRRFAVAERLGGAARFRDSVAALLPLPHSRPLQGTVQSPQPESQDELRAWNQFEKARELQDNDRQSRKRKSVTASPVEPAPEPERRLKRPRTRRPYDAGDASSDTGAESSTARRFQISIPRIVRPSEVSRPGPSFLSSLLKEVENTPPPSEASLNLRHSLQPGSPVPTDPASPAASSVASPVSSNHPSPRMRPSSPAMSHQSRPSSPPFTSRIEPMFVQRPHSPQSPQPRPHRQPLHQSPQYSPVSPIEPLSPQSNTESTDKPETRARSHRPKWFDPVEKRPDPPPSSSSAGRRDMSSSDKAEIRDMVSAALKPEYKKGKIDTDQFTTVNREISRMLYDKIGDAGGFSGSGGREKWQGVAADEVDAALEKMKNKTVVATA